MIQNLLMYWQPSFLINAAFLWLVFFFNYCSICDIYVKQKCRKCYFTVVCLNSNPLKMLKNFQFQELFTGMKALNAAVHKRRRLLFWRLSHLIWVLPFLDDCSNAGMSRKDISSPVTMAPKSRKLFKYLNIKRSSVDHKARFPILSTSFFFFFLTATT